MNNKRKTELNNLIQAKLEEAEKAGQPKTFEQVVNEIELTDNEKTSVAAGRRGVVATEKLPGGTS